MLPAKTERGQYIGVRLLVGVRVSVQVDPYNNSMDQPVGYGPCHSFNMLLWAAGVVVGANASTGPSVLRFFWCLWWFDSAPKMTEKSKGPTKRNVYYELKRSIDICRNTKVLLGHSIRRAWRRSRWYCGFSGSRPNGDTYASRPELNDNTIFKNGIHYFFTSMIQTTIHHYNRRVVKLCGPLNDTMSLTLKRASVSVQ